MNVDTHLHRLTVREQLTLSTLWFSLNASNGALISIVIPTQILLFVAPGQVGNAQQAAFLGWLSTLGAGMALVIPPFVGMISDTTTSLFGRRRPYIVAGTLFAVVSMVILIGAGNVVIFVLGLALFQVGMNVITAAYQSLTPDLVPEDQRGSASGYMGLMNILGNVLSLALAGLLFSQVSLQASDGGTIHNGLAIYYTFAIIALTVGVLITVVGIHERPLSPSTITRRGASEFQLRAWIEHNWISPWRDYNFMIVFLTRFAVMMGIALFMTFVEYYFANVAHITNFVQTTAAVAVLALLGAVISAFTLGVFSDRLQKRAPLVSMATICMALASFTFVIFSGNFPLWPLGILFGVGYGAYTSVDWALSVDSLPSLDTVGKDLGLWNASTNLPALLAPLVGSLIITVTNVSGQTSLGYRLVFATATLFLLLAAIFVLLVREHKENAPVEINHQSTHRHVHVGWNLAFRTHSGRARGFLRFWPFWEWVTRTFTHVQPIPHAPHNLMAVALTRYHGRPIDLPDGVHVQRGDPIIELHFNNQELLALAETATSWEYLQMIGRNLHALAVWMQQPDFPTDAEKIRAIYGVTLLSRGARRLGFVTRERPRNLHGRLERFFLMGLMVLYNPQGRSRLQHGTTYSTYPQESWMSQAELFKRYGDGFAAEE